MYDQYDLIKSINEMPPKIPKKQITMTKKQLKKLVMRYRIDRDDKFCF